MSKETCLDSCSPTKMRLVLLNALLPLMLLVSLTTGQSTFNQQVTVKKLDAPEIVDPRSEKLVLFCDYELHGKELYSVNWYKYDKVLFRYAPNLDEKALVYPNEHIRVSLQESDAKRLVILGHDDYRKNIRAYGGIYMCEVSAERTFLTSYEVANVSVAILPQNGPRLDGLAHNYQVGERLGATCSSMPSLPPSELGFYLNGHKVNPIYTRRDNNLKAYDDAITSSTKVLLELTLERRDFPNGILKLECLARLPNVPTAPEYKTVKTATLAASNQRLAQEAPKSSAYKVMSVNCGLMLLIYISL